MTDRHDICPMTLFCVRCGVSLYDIADGNADRCHHAHNVIAISHIIAARRFTAIIGPFDWGDVDPDPDSAA